jgi:hypothetical protein
MPGMRCNGTDKAKFELEKKSCHSQSHVTVVSMLSGKGWGTADVATELGGPGTLEVLSNTRCNLSEGLLKVRTIVSHIYSHIRSDLDQDQLEPDPKLLNANMLEKIITAMNQTYLSGDFVLLKHNKATTNPTVTISDPSGASYNGNRFGYSVAAGGFMKQDLKGRWIGNTTRDVALTYSRDTFDQQYSDLTEASMLMHNLLHATIRESFIAEATMSATEAWDRTMRLIWMGLVEPYAPRSLWSVTVDDERIDVEIRGHVRGVGRNGSLRIEEERRGIWHFFWNDLLVVAFDAHNRSYERPNTHPTATVTRLVQCPFNGIVVEGQPFMPFDWGMWPTNVSCTSSDKKSTFVMAPGDFKSMHDPLEIIAWDANRHIDGIFHVGDSSEKLVAHVRDATKADVPAYARLQESRASVVYNACCSVSQATPSSKKRGVESLTQWVADSYADQTVAVPPLSRNSFVLIPLSRDDQWSKSSPPAKLLRFGASSALAGSWCVGGYYGHETDALEAVISWADKTNEV